MTDCQDTLWFFYLLLSNEIGTVEPQQHHPVFQPTMQCIFKSTSLFSTVCEYLVVHSGTHSFLTIISVMQEFKAIELHLGKGEDSYILQVMWLTLHLVLSFGTAP